ncbi:unnamed protein product, partial [Leptidea sinapis]
MRKSSCNSLKFDDTVHCTFFSSNALNENEWKELSHSINNTIASLSTDYIWNRDEFKVYLPVFSSCTNEDEWFIIYLVLQISKMHEDLLIHVEDNDGYFLLIEAANHLPSWLNPESAENRVFIYQNNVHIIPPDVSDLEKQLSISDAIQLIFRNPETTKADILIQDSIRNRSFKLFKSIDTNDKKNQLGLKLTCGFKIIENQSTKDIFSSSEYLKFLSSLTKNGYFKDNIEGSKDYMQLLEKAKSYFSNIECPINTQVCHEISDLKLLDVFVDTKNKVISNSNLNMSEDDDDWLDVSPEQINNILNTRYGESDNMDESKLKPSNQITSTLADFLKTTSDFEGIERP